jgi:hypothetical protein
VDAVEEMDSTTLRRFRLGFVLIAYAVFVLQGFRNAVGAEPSLSGLAIAVLAAVAVTKACIMDSRLIGKPLPRAARWITFFLWPLAVPVYLLWSRGWMGLAWIFVHFGALTLAFVVPWIVLLAVA